MNPEQGEWGAAPEGQEGLSFIIDAMPLTPEIVEQMQHGGMVPTIAIFLDDKPTDGVVSP